MADVIEKLKEYAQYAETKSERDTFEVAFQEITRLREENARLREELQKEFNAMRVFARYRELEAEIETLRKAVKSAYYEGWRDNASIDDTEDRLHAEWAFSEACAAIGEKGK